MSTIKKLDFGNFMIWKENITVSGQVSNNEKFQDVDYFIDGKPFVTQKHDSILIFYSNGTRVKAKLSKGKRVNPSLKENVEPIGEELKNKFFHSAELSPMFYGGQKAIS